MDPKIYFAFLCIISKIALVNGYERYGDSTDEGYSEENEYTRKKYLAVRGNDGQWYLVSRVKPRGYYTKMATRQYGYSVNRYNRYRWTKTNYKSKGVFFTKNGFWYKGSYYRRNCSLVRLYYTLRSCSYIRYGIDTCIPWLYKRRLIGRRQVYMRNGHGSGVRFVAHRWIVFGRIFYQIYRSETRLSNYMASCVSSGWQVMNCLNELQRRKWIGLAHILNHRKLTKKIPDKHPTTKSSKDSHQDSSSAIIVKFINGRFVHKGKQYRLRATQKNFLRLWFRCIRRYYHENVCFRRLKILKIYSPYTKGHQGELHVGNSHMARHLVYTKNIFTDKALLHGHVVVHHTITRTKLKKKNTDKHPTTKSSKNSHQYSSSPIKVKFINGRFVYKGKEYRLRATQKNFLRLWFRCIRRYYHENVCFRRLKILKIYSPYAKGHQDDFHVGNSHMARHLVYSKNIFTDKLLSHGYVVVHHPGFGKGTHHGKKVKHSNAVNEQMDHRGQSTKHVNSFQKIVNNYLKIHKREYIPHKSSTGYTYKVNEVNKYLKTNKREYIPHKSSTGYAYKVNEVNNQYVPRGTRRNVMNEGRTDHSYEEQNYVRPYHKQRYVHNVPHYYEYKKEDSEDSNDSDMQSENAGNSNYAVNDRSIVY